MRNAESAMQKANKDDDRVNNISLYHRNFLDFPKFAEGLYDLQ